MILMGDTEATERYHGKFFFFNDTATTEIYTLSLHDALPISGKPFRITQFELGFYRKHNLPVPTIHPLERIRELFLTWRHPFKLWKAKCVKCSKEIWSGYDPARKLKVYCESCYNSEVV